MKKTKIPVTRILTATWKPAFKIEKLAKNLNHQDHLRTGCTDMSLKPSQIDRKLYLRRSRISLNHWINFCD